MKSVLTILLLLIAQVFVMNAEISYHDYVPDSVLSGDGQHPMYMDIDIDGIGDFDFTIAFHEQIQFFSGYNGSLVLVDESNNVPLVLESGYNINTGSRLWFDSFHSSLNLTDIWPGNFDKFIGLKFKSNNQWHYGWLRISAPEDGLSVIVKDFAWETTPEQAINAGDGIGTEVKNNNSNSEEICIFPNPASNLLKISGITEPSNIEILNTLGVVCKRILVIESIVSFDISDLAEGVYFVKHCNKVYRIIKQY